MKQILNQSGIQNDDFFLFQTQDNLLAGDFQELLYDSDCVVAD